MYLRNYNTHLHQSLTLAGIGGDFLLELYIKAASKVQFVAYTAKLSQSMFLIITIFSLSFVRVSTGSKSSSSVGVGFCIGSSSSYIAAGRNYERKKRNKICLVGCVGTRHITPTVNTQKEKV